jgi:Family of unknown function (DUF6703)
MSQPFRDRVEQRSAAALARLSRFPAWLPLVVALALTVAGLLIPGPLGALLLLVLAALLGWLGYLSWPALGGSARVVRLLVLALILAAAARQYTLS